MGYNNSTACFDLTCVQIFYVYFYLPDVMCISWFIYGMSDSYNMLIGSASVYWTVSNTTFRHCLLHIHFVNVFRLKETFTWSTWHEIPCWITFLFLILFSKIVNEDNLKILLCLMFHSVKMVLPLVDTCKWCQWIFTSTRAVLFVLSAEKNRHCSVK